jgi:hypothetical protein
MLSDYEKNLLHIKLDDSKPLPELVENIIESDGMTTAIGKLFADGSHEGNDVFGDSADNRILSCIKVRKNAKVGPKKGNFFRNLSVLAQKKDLQAWTDSVSYGKRWIVETGIFLSKKNVWIVYLFCKV